MIEKEIGEIRRRIRRDRSNATAIYGCYVNENKEIISSFRQSVGMMSENEAERYFAVLRRTLSGTIGKNLNDLIFRTAQVANSSEHKFLMDLRKSQLADDDLRMQLYQKIIDTVAFDNNYVILLICDSYDVPFKSKDGQVQADASEDVYTYFLCAVCPVKQTKAALKYTPESKDFHDGGISQQICSPEVGFLFPAFDNRSTNIYSALLYTRSSKENFENFVDSLFQIQAPKPAEVQKKSFEALLTTTLGNDCSLDVVQSIHSEICQSIVLHKESKDPETLLISKKNMTNILQDCGVKQENISKFSIAYDEAFGFEADLHPKNIINNRQFEIKTPDVSIKVNPERSDLIETRVISGVKYIMICADENVEVNGVSIKIDGDE